MKRFLLLIVVVLLSIHTYAFDIYQYIIWKKYRDNSGNLYEGTNNDFQKFMGANNLKPIRVIYHEGFLTNGNPDVEKIKKIVLVSKKFPHIPVSFDIEVGNKFKKETLLPIVNQTLDLYHQYGGAAKVGVFGVLPQSVFGTEKFNHNTQKQYIELNKEYEGIGQKVDFLSPVIYNLWFNDFNVWKRRVDFQLSEAQKYAKKYNLKIIPYYSSVYLDKGFHRNGKVADLTEAEMNKRLNYIKSKSVDGVIIWNPSGGKFDNNEQGIFDVNKGSSKAIVNFAKK